MARAIVLLFILISCHTGKLKVINDLPNGLKEVSAIEKTVDSDLLWLIEDSGNANTLYAININGEIVKDIEIDNAVNIDWEDLTSDKSGNIYIGDFGNNAHKRKVFSIYKVIDPMHSNKNEQALTINFKLPKDIYKQDFEAFFIYNDHFYIFNKDHKETMLFKVPNKIGTHTAKIITRHSFAGKHNAITSADISNDGKTVVLLNSDKLWKLSGFEGDDFFSGRIEKEKFEHKSQKEGICFNDENSFYINDERKGHSGGNLYYFDLKFE